MRRNEGIDARDRRAAVNSVVLVSTAMEETVCSFMTRTLGALCPLQKEPQLHLGVQPLFHHDHFEDKLCHCRLLPLATGWLV